MASVLAPLPRVTIQFCTQCKWMLRAAYVGVDFRDLNFNHYCNLDQLVDCRCSCCSLRYSIFVSALHVTTHHWVSVGFSVNVITG